MKKRKMHVFVLKMKTVKKTLTVALLLIVMGISLFHPPLAQAAEPPLFYVYPVISNNPVSSSGMFWSEAHPDWGSMTLSQWESLFKSYRLVVGVPDQFTVRDDFFSASPKTQSILTQLKKGIKKRLPSGEDGKNMKDSITVKKVWSPNKVEEEVSVEIGKHFRDNDNFDQYIDKIREVFTPSQDVQELLKEAKAPLAPPIDNAAKVTTWAGGAILLTGLSLLAKVLMFAAAI